MVVDEELSAIEKKTIEFGLVRRYGEKFKIQNSKYITHMYYKNVYDVLQSSLCSSY